MTEQAFMQRAVALALEKMRATRTRVVKAASTRNLPEPPSVSYNGASIDR
jgi:hypothetical protein